MLNKKKNSCNTDKNYNSNLIKYILIWICYLAFSAWCIATEQGNIILRLIAFPFNIVIIYLVIQAIEMRRAAKYIKKRYPDLWKKIKAHAVGNYIKQSWIFESNEDIQDETLIKIKKNLRQFIIFTILTILYISVLIRIYTYFK